MADSVSPGDGFIHARLLPPSRFVLPSLEFVYPLKLISTSPPAAPYLTVFLLSYGGGLVSDDKINLKILLEEHAKLCLLTQGSTKIFKRKHPSHHTSQTLTITLHPSSALLLLPDPIQPFADSYYTQHQIVNLPPDDTASFVLLDWVSEGRTARGERWDLARFESRNEIYTTTASGRRRLLLRDALVLDSEALGGESLCGRMDGFSCVATVIVRGPRFAGLAEWALQRYTDEPRIGGKGFAVKVSEDEAEKRKWEVLWTATSVRGFVLMKVSGKELEEVRGFLKEFLEDEGSVVREFGGDALRCLQ
ncbi:uncharacterized protein H6S33_008619 [Morchella sextelata]|uniref:uncharacterized protein n=1 Tax=Morchella sextelata TaxID=1174677 RepID=UPI001D04BA22|nr:uncharacterized protein H6S33_008619 [Morchella sextelata]KAH0602538.1 hypothetical protein H6S33_008619 [Morchella sextelata]